MKTKSMWNGSSRRYRWDKTALSLGLSLRNWPSFILSMTSRNVLGVGTGTASNSASYVALGGAPRGGQLPRSAVQILHRPAESAWVASSNHVRDTGRSY